MLNLIFSKSIDKKTEYVRELVSKGIKEGNKNYIFIVPEQFSYETEKAMLEKIGAKALLDVEVISLSRLADVILEEKGMLSKKIQVDKGIKMMTMSIALESLVDKLDVFKKYSANPALIESLVSFATEMKQCSVTTEMLGEYVKGSQENSLCLKIKELVLIISLYNAMIEKDYYNSDDNLDLLDELFNSYAYFENKTVVIDGFTRFTKQESKIIEKAVKQSENVYISFHSDNTTSKNEFSIFANINKQVEKLKNIARKCNVKIAEPVLIDWYDSDVDEYISIIKENAFSIEKEAFFETNPDSVAVVSCPNKSAECEFTAQNIKKLMRCEQARCRDIIIYERTKDSYDRELAAALKKYDIPFFEDKRQPIEKQPLIVYLQCLLNIACNGISTDTVLRYLKTDLTELTAEEISLLENYAFIWKIKASDWQNEFVENPRGFGSELNDFDKEDLNKLNELRKKAIAPILAFKRDFTQAESEQKSKIIYEHIVKQGVKAKIRGLSEKLSESGAIALCEEQETIWTLFIDMLDKLYIVSKQYNPDNSRFFELFNILLSVSDFGTLPGGLDQVTIGVADRTRTSMKKYVFVVGANDGIFPLNPTTQGLLNDKERIALKKSGVELAETADYKQIEEKYTAYTAISTARRKLFVTYSQSQYNAESLSPSVIVNEIKSVFPDLKEKNFEDISLLEKIESDYSAFESLSKLFKENNELKVTLEEYFFDKDLFKGRIEALKAIVEKKKMNIENRDTAVRLFSSDINLSASKIQSFFECPFKFYCQYGIKAEPITQAEIDPRLSGNIIHEIFETIIGKYTKEELEKISDDSLTKEINCVLDNYIGSKMGGADNKSTRFIQQYYALGQQAFNIMKRIIEELKTCEFSPVDFELGIRMDAEIRPYELELPDGGKIRISGSVDRVDTMVKDGKTYLRVVDYKSGKKYFKLSDVLDGLNTQMLIYLFAIEKNGKEKYGDIVPCGVLYMPVKQETEDLPRNAGEEDIKRVRLQKNKMSGIVLNDFAVAESMEKELKGNYIPASVDKNGNLTGKLISEQELKALNKKIDEIIIGMGTDIHNGYVEALPVEPKKCENCNYRSICHFEDGDAVREIRTVDHKQALVELMREDESDE